MASTLFLLLPSALPLGSQPQSICGIADLDLSPDSPTVQDELVALLTVAAAWEPRFEGIADIARSDGRTERLPLTFDYNVTPSPAWIGFLPKDTDVVVTVRSLDDSACAATVQTRILNSPPEARLEIDAPQPTHRGHEIVVDASASLDADGDPLSFAWSAGGEPHGSGSVVRMVASSLGPLSIEVAVSDGEATASTVQTVLVENRRPEGSDLAVRPSKVIKRQPFVASFQAEDGDAARGYDDLAFRVRVGSGASMETDGTTIALNSSTPGQGIAVNVTIDDGHARDYLQEPVTIFDRDTPRFPVPGPSLAGVRVFGIEVGTGASPPPHEEGGIVWLARVVPPDDATALSNAVSAAAFGAKIVYFGASLPLTDALRSIVDSAIAGGATIIVPAAPAGSHTTGLASHPGVFTVGWTADGVTVLSAPAPADGWAAKPDCVVAAASGIDAARATARLFATLQERGVAEPLSARLALMANAKPMPGVPPMAQGCGLLEALPDDVLLQLPLLAATAYVDFGVVNDETPGPADLSVLNLNGVLPRIARLLASTDAPLPPEVLRIVQTKTRPEFRVSSAFFHIGDLLELGLSPLAFQNTTPVAYPLVAERRYTADDSTASPLELLRKILVNGGVAPFYDAAVNRGKYFASAMKGTVTELCVYAEEAGTEAIVAVKAAPDNSAPYYEETISIVRDNDWNCVETRRDHPATTLFIYKTGGDAAIGYDSNSPHDSRRLSGTSWVAESYRRGFRVTIVENRPVETTLLANDPISTSWDSAANRGKLFTSVPAGTVTEICAFGRYASTSVTVAGKPRPDGAPPLFEETIPITKSQDWNCKGVEHPYHAETLFLYRTGGNAQIRYDTGTSPDSYHSNDGELWTADNVRRGYRATVTAKDPAPSPARVAELASRLAPLLEEQLSDNDFDLDPIRTLSEWDAAKSAGDAIADARTAIEWKHSGTLAWPCLPSHAALACRRQS